MRADGKLLGHITITEDLDAGAFAVGQANAAQRIEIHARAIFKNVQRFDVYGNVNRGVARVVETALRNAANERHLATLETDADRAAGPGRLALATASRRFAVTAGFTLAEPLAAMLGARTRF